jgi:hypothetical protein
VVIGTGGGIGRRNGFRFHRREAWGFKSPPVHFQGVTGEVHPDGLDPAAAFAAANAAATDAELEWGILEAVRLGALDVARVLSRQLEERQAATRMAGAGSMTVVPR